MYLCSEIVVDTDTWIAVMMNLQWYSNSIAFVLMDAAVEHVAEKTVADLIALTYFTGSFHFSGYVGLLIENHQSQS